MLVITMGLFDTGGGATIALMTRRAAKFVGVVRLQQIGLGMAGERVGVLVGFFALERHSRSRKFDGLANAHVTGFATVHDVGFGNVDLDDFRFPGFGFVL